MAKSLEITFWHSMAGNLGRTLEKIVNDFNNNNDDYKIISVYKGTYSEVLTSTVAAFRSNSHPDLVQIFDIATATMINPPGVIKPMHEVFALSKQQLNTKQFVQAAIDYYSNEQGDLLAAPFNLSTPMLFYNRDVFSAAGLDPDLPPQTWQDLELIAKTLIQKNLTTYGFSSTWIGWSLFESFSLIHNLAYATNNNGFDGLDIKVAFNNDKTRAFIQQLLMWQQDKVFLYGGRIDDAQSFFTSGKCAMLIQSSGAYADLYPSVSFSLGMARVPYLDSYTESDLGNLVGGAAIWAMDGLSKEKYLAIAKFIQYLCSPAVQAYWQNSTGYISIVKSQFLPEQQNTNKIIAMNLKRTQDFVISREKKYKGIRLGNYMQIRDLVERQLEAVWARYSEVSPALLRAEEEANIMLQRFKRNVRE